MAGLAAIIGMVKLNEKPTFLFDGCILYSDPLLLGNESEPPNFTFVAQPQAKTCGMCPHHQIFAFYCGPTN